MTDNTFVNALNNKVSQVLYENHCFDNTFIRSSVAETISELNHRQYIPIGICLEPEYAPWDGIGLVVETADFEKIWCHVPKALVRCWQRELNINILSQQGET